jgi:hypothetical protein
VRSREARNVFTRLAELSVHGERIASVGRRKAGMKVRDPAVVLAIFPGVPWLVVTDARPVGTKLSAWVNPFMAGRPERFEYFSPPAGD